MTISLTAKNIHGNATLAPDRLTALRIAHVVTTLLSEWHLPAAVYWRQSNQLLTGSQYLRLARDNTPWALFTHARTQTGDDDAATGAKTWLRLDEAIELIGRPITFAKSDQPLDLAHASALSFLRFAMENGAPIPHGHSFGPKDGPMVRVAHVPASPEEPLGRFDLRFVEPRPEEFVSSRPSAVASRPGDIPVEPALAYHVSNPKSPTRPAGWSQSRAVSYMLLLVMPPIGLFLLIFNAIFGDNAWRTGMIATASVALALVVGAYSFLNYVGQETAVFIGAPATGAAILTD